MAPLVQRRDARVPRVGVLDAVGGNCVDRRTREGRIDRLPWQGAEFDRLDKRFYNFGDKLLGRILIRVDEIHRSYGIPDAPLKE